MEGFEAPARPNWNHQYVVQWEVLARGNRASVPTLAAALAWPEDSVRATVQSGEIWTNLKWADARKSDVTVPNSVAHSWPFLILDTLLSVDGTEAQAELRRRYPGYDETIKHNLEWLVAGGYVDSAVTPAVTEKGRRVATTVRAMQRSGAELA